VAELADFLLAGAPLDLLAAGWHTAVNDRGTIGLSVRSCRSGSTSTMFDETRVLPRVLGDQRHELLDLGRHFETAVTPHFLR
jgi:hypothetical protein